MTKITMGLRPRHTAAKAAESHGGIQYLQGTGYKKPRGCWKPSLKNQIRVIPLCATTLEASGAAWKRASYNSEGYVKTQGGVAIPKFGARKTSRATWEFPVRIMPGYRFASIIIGDLCLRN